MKLEPAEMAEIVMEVEIDGTPERVWQALTKNIDTWWPAEFYSGGKAGKRSFYLETRPGGGMGEVWDEGGGVLWASVIGVHPNISLQVTGTAFPAWGGPSQWLGSWELSGNGKRTKLKFIENSIGRVSDDYMADKDKGWRFLWQALKAHVEGKKPPKWRD